MKSLWRCAAESKIKCSEEEVEEMCDYSLAGIPNRLAVEGERLVFHRFSTGSIGLASPCASPSRWWSAKQTPAVCIPPGARLLLRDIPKDLQQQLGVGGTEEVTFVQLSATPYQFRDAVRFNNGRDILCSNSNVASRWRCCRSPQVISSTKDTAGLRKNISAFS